MNEVARVKRELMFEKFAPADVLKVNISNPVLGNTFITKIVQVFQKQASKQPTIKRIGTLGAPRSE